MLKTKGGKAQKRRKRPEERAKRKGIGDSRFEI
jgi:hypothetical protein